MCNRRISFVTGKNKEAKSCPISTDGLPCLIDLFFLKSLRYIFFTQIEDLLIAPFINAFSQIFNLTNGVAGFNINVSN